MKNPPPFTPSQSEISAEIVDEFEKHQHRIIALFRQLDTIDLEKTVIYSPALRIITYSIADLLIILAGHEQRHLTQAKGVLNHPKFPK